MDELMAQAERDERTVFLVWVFFRYVSITNYRTGKYEWNC